MSDRDLSPALIAVLESAARLQELVPDAVLVVDVCHAIADAIVEAP